MQVQELRERLKKCAYRCIKLCEALPHSLAANTISKQLIRSSLSASANYRAATRAQSKKQFLSKLNIALEEIDETCFWIEAIEDLELMSPPKINPIYQEAIEFTKILAATKKTTQANLQNSNNQKSQIINHKQHEVFY